MGIPWGLKGDAVTWEGGRIDVAAFLFIITMYD
jgi:hypothetical protein